MSRFTVLLLGLLVASVAACEESAPTSSSAPQSPTSAPAAALTDEDLPVPADFAEEAEREVTAASYKSELDAIEKELEGG